MGNSSKEKTKAFEVSPTADETHGKSNTLRNLIQVSTRCVEISQQSKRQPIGPCPSDLSGTGLGSQNTSTSTDTQAYVERETSPSSIFSDDLEDIFRKDTDTVMGVYGSDSNHSSVSEQSTDDDILRTRPPTKLISALEGIGSHLVDYHATRDNLEVQFDRTSVAQDNEARGVARTVEGIYTPMCFPEATEGPQSSVLLPPEERAVTRNDILNKLYSLDLIMKETAEVPYHRSGLSSIKGRKMAKTMRVAQEDLERQQRLYTFDEGKARVVRSPVKRFIVCVLGIAVLVTFFLRFRVI